MPPVVSLCLAALITTAVRACPLLRTTTLAFRRSYSDANTWVATVLLSEWQAGVVVTVAFPEEGSFAESHVTKAAYAELVHDDPPIASFRLQQERPPKSGSGYTLFIEGSGGCWGAANDMAAANDCELPLVTCDLAPRPGPPPNPPPSPPPSPLQPLQVGAPRVVKACGGSVDLAWDPPPFAASSSAALLQYKVSAQQVGAGVPAKELVVTGETLSTVGDLSPGAVYSFTVAVRHSAAGGQWQGGPPLEMALPSDLVDLSKLAITPGTSDQSCDTLELTVPNLPADPYECHTNDFLSIEWRIARASDSWQPVLDHIGTGDLTNNLLVVDKLDPYEAFEFRALLHHVPPGGGSGQIISGPSTGALMVGLLRNELLNAPTATATSSASVDIVLPHISHCRSKLHQLIWYATDADADDEGEGDWQLLPEAGVVRDGRHVYANTVRCVSGCRFRWSTEDVEGWEEASQVSNLVKSPQAYALDQPNQRLELRLGALAPDGAEATTTNEWKQRFGEDLSTALSLPRSSVDVVEVRAAGEYVMFDVPRSAATPKTPTPAAALAALMKQPACSTNLALDQPGRCSSSCGNGTSPAHVNDGDLRQYAPHVWQACPTDRGPWWSVQLPQSMRRPYVRILVGDCCAQSFRRTIDVRIGAESGQGATKCASLVVDDGSAVGAFCEGEGDWLTISAPGSFALAEVQVCEAAQVNPLLRQPMTSTVDTSAGLVEVNSAGTQTAQLVPILLALLEPGRNAAWRSKASGGGRLTMVLIVVALGTGAVALLVIVIYGLLRGLSRRSFARVSKHDGPDTPMTRDEDEMLDDDDDDIEDQHRQFVGSGSVPVTFEWTDGTTMSARVHLDGITGMDEVFSAVKTAAKKALGGHPPENFSLQYQDLESNQFEEAWFDPILGEGSEVKDVARAKQWRVLILGESVEISSSAMSL